MSVDASLMRDGGLSYLEIPAIDLRASAEFYGGVFNWKVDGSDPSRPKFSDKTGHLIGRWTTDRASARDAGFMLYFYVEQIREVVKRAAAAGGQIVKAPYPEGDLFIATIRDPAGNLIGVWEAAS